MSTAAAISQAPGIQLDGVGKDYGSTRALDGIDLCVEAGQFLVLLGPSGSGKSTLLRGVAGIERFDRGRVTLAGTPVDDRGRHVAPEHRDLAMVFQDYALWPHMTALRNVAYALRRRGLGRRDTDRKALEALGRVGLDHLAARYPHEMSGGEQQRVGLARAIVARPALLLFDEPLSNLDTDLRERLRVEIATVTRDCGATAVYITHDQSEAFALADRIGILRDGCLEQLDSPEVVYRNPATPFVARFTGTSGQLCGRVVERRAEDAIVQIGSGQLLARTAARVGDTVTVLIRPSATSLQPAAARPPRGSLPGTIVDIAYRGRGYDHVVDCGHGLLTAVFDASAWTRGTLCQVAVDRAGCTAFTRPNDESPTDLTAVRLSGTDKTLLEARS